MEKVIESEMIIDAPAAVVWEVLAHRFGDIAEWASIMKSSKKLTHADKPTGAAVSGRVCSAYGFGEVQEDLLDYDEQAMRFRYQAVKGLPFFIRYAENNWSVEPLSERQCKVHSKGVMRMGPITGNLLYPFFSLVMHRMGDRLFKDLKGYVEED